MDNLKTFLLEQSTNTFNPYINGKMSYQLYGKEWSKYVRETFPDLGSQVTSENIFKDVLDLYKGSVMPVLPELSGMKNILPSLLARGESLATLAPDGSLSWPENYEIISDGTFTLAAIFTRSLEKMEDYVTFIDSKGNTELRSKPVPENLAPATREGYQFVEDGHGYGLFRFDTGDKGMGAHLASLQDRVNHSIIDQTVVSEMYVRPFWYLLNYQAPPTNPYLKNQPTQKIMEEQQSSGAGRIFATSSEGPFGQLEPPSLSEMNANHDSIISKVSQSMGIPEYYLKPGGGNVPSGIALQTLRERYTSRVADIRGELKPELMRLATALDIAGAATGEIDLWNNSDDLLQEALDTHGLALAQMGYPLDYIAEVVTPGVDLNAYGDDGYPSDLSNG